MELCFPSTIFLMLLLFHPLQLHKSAYGNDEMYEKCKKPFQCGNVSLSYPFYDGRNHPPYCGYPGFQIDCSNGIPEISMSSEIYYILNMDPTSHTISVAWQSYWDDVCPQNLFNASISLSLYKYTPEDENITLIYNCPIPATLKGNGISCNNSKNYRRNYSPSVYIMTQDLESSLSKNLNKTCPDNTLVSVPVLHTFHGGISDINTLMAALQIGFRLEWIAENDLCDGCRISGGECGSDTTMSKFICYCPDRPYDSKCNPGGNGSTHHKLATLAGAIIASFVIVLAMLALLAFYVKRRYSTDDQNIDALLKRYGPLTPKRYTYRSLKRITFSFKDKLGEGGFGVVYKGKLRNGHPVAVKLLKESTGNADDFISEVTSIGRTNHVNVVILLGFCYEGQKRALVYPFMPKESLDKFITRKNNYQSLAWDKLFEIAVGIARDLEYLLRGCNTRIVHFDIKPRNILLDENLCPKISDFGLAKLCQQNVSIVSMSKARGTVGFIAPEVYRQSFGVVSHKSDVYSYGMLVLDMVGCRKNVNADVRYSTEYFPDWIYNQLEQTEQIGHQGILYGEENGTLRKMVLVSLWCIQTNPSTRPPMSRVVEMLEGPLELLKIAPKPSLSFSQISLPNSSTESTISV